MLPKVGHFLLRVQQGLERICLVVGVSSTFILMLVSVADITGRYAFNHPVEGATEFSALLMAAIVFLATAYVQSIRSHIKIDLLFSNLPGKGNLILEIFGNLIGLFILGIVSWQSGALAWRAWYTHDYTLGIIKFPLWPAKTIFTLGVGLLASRLVFDVVGGFRRLLSKSNVSGVNRQDVA